jgi:hypothetical protein
MIELQFSPPTCTVHQKFGEFLPFNKSRPAYSCCKLESLISCTWYMYEQLSFSWLWKSEEYLKGLSFSSVLTSMHTCVLLKNEEWKFFLTLLGCAFGFFAYSWLTKCLSGNQNWCFELLFFYYYYAKLCWNVIDNCLVKTIIVSCMSHAYRWTTFTNYMGWKLKLLNSQMRNLEPFGFRLVFQSELPSCPSWWWHWCNH